jgi:hypothetical protein
MSVFDLRTFRCEIEHAALGCVERIAISPVTATVFSVASQDRGEELRGNFIVLTISRARVNGNRAGFQLPDVAHEVSLLALRIAFVFGAETLRDETPDPGS